MGLTQEQLLERQNYIGASDAAGVLGLSRWRTPIEVWAEKTGQVPQEDKSGILAIEVGVELEDLVAKLFTKRTGLKVRRANETRFHKTHPFLACNLDRLIEGTDEILECKTASGWKAKEWEGEEIPQEYVIQVLFQLAVTGKKRGHIACLIGGNADFRYKVVERDEVAIKQIVEKCAAFWTTRTSCSSSSRWERRRSPYSCPTRLLRCSTWSRATRLTSRRSRARSTRPRTRSAPCCRTSRSGSSAAGRSPGAMSSAAGSRPTR